MHARFQVLARYAVDAGAQGILFTCSAFGPCIEAVARRYAPMPVLKPNEAMIDEAMASGAQRIGLIASFAPTLQTMPAEFPAGATLSLALAEGAMAALDAGDGTAHDRLVAEQGCDLIALAQFSMARAQKVVVDATGLPVLTTVDSAVRVLRRRLNATG